MIYYEIKVKYDHQVIEDNKKPNKPETYLVEGITCADVEQRLIDYLKPFISGDWEVLSCKRSQFYELIPSPEGDKWYKGRVEMITIEESGKETRKPTTFYVQASNITEANKSLHQALSNLDCEVIGVTRSSILEVFRAVQ